MFCISTAQFWLLKIDRSAAELSEESEMSGSIDFCCFWMDRACSILCRLCAESDGVVLILFESRFTKFFFFDLFACLRSSI